MTLEVPQHVTLNGAKFVVRREAIVLVAYHDGKHEDGSLKYSIGAGSQTPTVKPGDRITLEEGFARLRADIATRELILNRLLKVRISDHAFDALFSLFYQAGTAAARGVADVFNSRGEVWAAAEFIRYNHGADKVPSEGHTIRRIREMSLVVDGNYGDLSEVLVIDGDPRNRATPRREMPFPETGEE